MTQLIICEKPSAAKKVAESLAEGKITKKIIEKVNYYEITRNKKKIVVASAVGHLFGLKAKDKSWKYPDFSYEWAPAYEVSKSADFTKKYLDVLKILVKESNEFINSCDLDIEGETIFNLILEKVIKKKDAKRMKFSTMTKEDLVQAYEKVAPHIEHNLATAGRIRHSLDWLWGINLSRALMHSIKKAGSFKIMSIGRVQGPTLALLTQRELEIKKFKPEPFWEIELLTDKLNAWHKKGKFTDKKEVEEILKKTKGKPAIVKSIKKISKIIKPPTPFDLTSLQVEAYRHLDYTPKQTLQIAQKLYIAGYISYPRTSSQKLPTSLGFPKIIGKLGKQSKFSKLVKLLPKNLKPNEGGKTDPAHPAIFVTGEIGKLNPRDSKLYDLIAHRFLATFGTDAKRETSTGEIDVNKEIFTASRTKTLEPGWFILYGRFAKYSEEEFPNLKEQQELNVKNINPHEKETQPPKRYSQASIIKELEKKSLGTKATRSQILDTLYQRNYIQEKSIEVTDFGIKTIQTLKKYVSEILDEKLTRHFENELEDIRSAKKKPDLVIDKAQEVLKKILKEFEKNELKIGKELVEANRETRIQDSLIGKCPNCEKGLLN
ncbi:MAG: DNA topoisomerase I, partial [Nanoarchaeota archaeon]